MKLQGRGIHAGRGAGEAVVTSSQISFLGDVNPVTGAVSCPDCSIKGESVAGKVFAFDSGKGSTVGSYVLYQMRRRGTAPAGIINRKAEAIVASGAVIAGIPMVDSLDPDLFRHKDSIVLDGSTGLVEVKGVEERNVVTVFLAWEGKVLVLRRSMEASTFPGKWAGISGYIETGEGAREAAVRETAEEVGVAEKDLTSLRSASLLWVREGMIMYKVHPFLGEVAFRGISTSEEYIEHRWLPPSEISGLDSVPKLSEALRSVFKTWNDQPMRNRNLPSFQSAHNPIR